jgi:hypothetical protein
MASLIDIKGVGARARELLEAAGVTTVADLADAGADTLHRDLVARNEAAQIMKSPPSLTAVASWIEGARAVAAATATAPSPTPAAAGGAGPGPVHLGADDFAVLAASALEATELYDVHGQRIAANQRGLRAAAARRQPLDLSRVHTFDDLNAGRIEVKPLVSRRRGGTEAPAGSGGAGGDRLDDLGLGGDLGLDPGAEDAAKPASAYTRRKLQRVRAGENSRPSRFVRRGLENHHPVATYLWMAVALATRLLTILLLVGTPAVLLTREFGGPQMDFVWVLVPLFAALLVLGAMHLIGISKVRCAVCSCPVLYSRHCRKNQKAHRLFPLGHVGATALHAVLFRWYRCMYCGTPSQLGRDPHKDSSQAEEF